MQPQQRHMAGLSLCSPQGKGAHTVSRTPLIPNEALTGNKCGKSPESDRSSEPDILPHNYRDKNRVLPALSSELWNVLAYIYIVWRVAPVIACRGGDLAAGGEGCNWLQL